jgi:hypothetical protein
LEGLPKPMPSSRFFDLLYRRATFDTRRPGLRAEIQASKYARPSSSLRGTGTRLRTTRSGGRTLRAAASTSRFAHLLGPLELGTSRAIAIRPYTPAKSGAMKSLMQIAGPWGAAYE